jgi:hypothetical protein
VNLEFIKVFLNHFEHQDRYHAVHLVILAKINHLNFYSIAFYKEHLVKEYEDALNYILLSLKAFLQIKI